MLSKFDPQTSTVFITDMNFPNQPIAVATAPKIVPNAENTLPRKTTRLPSASSIGPIATPNPKNPPMSF